MKKLWLAPLPALLAAALVLPAPRRTDSAPPAALDRSPTDLALSRDGKWAVTANATADSVSLIDLSSGTVISETPVGDHPFGVALTPDGKRAVVSNRLGDSVSILSVSAKGLKLERTLPVGDEPRGVVVSPDGAQAFVALAGANAVALVDLHRTIVRTRWPVGVEPWHLALTPDGKRLAVGNSRSRDVTVLDAATGKTLHTVPLRGRNLRHVGVSPSGEWAYVATISERGLGATRPNIDRGWVVGNRLARVHLSAAGPREAITLDTQGHAVADVDGLALSPDGKTLALTAAGTHELLLLRLGDLPFIAYGGPGDHIDEALRSDPARFRRVPLGGRPLGARFTPDGKSVVVANYLSNTVQIVDVASGAIAKTVALGGPAQPTLARRGEAIFCDAERSFNQWFSCNTCHVEGHTNGGNFDTLNDGGYGKPKKTLSLRGVSRTGPYTWHGWQSELRDAVHGSLISSMQGPEPSQPDLDALQAYFETLDFVPSPHSVSPAARRGRVVFEAKACASCHGGPDFATPLVASVGLEEPDDKYKGFNPPSLRNVYNRGPFLHDGRAETLEEVLTQHHRPSKLAGGPDPTPAELADLIAYLNTL